MIDALFQIINTIILVLIGIYIYKRFFAHNLKQELAQEVATDKLLHDDIKDLLDAQKKIQKETTEQDRACQLLLIKITQWHDVIVQQKNKLESDRKHNLQLARQRAELQSQNYALKRIQEKVLPLARQQVTKDLEAYFARQEHIDTYMHSLIDYINK